jgi:hypothetical protein
LPEVVSNTSPLQYLHQLGLLDLLPRLVGRAGLLPAIEPQRDRLDALGFRLAGHTRSAVLRLAGE